MEKNNEPAYVVIPLEKISEEALTGLVSEFILREGTDYGREEVSLDQKQAQIKKQLASGETIVVFDTVEESVSLMRKQHLKNVLKSHPVPK